MRRVRIDLAGRTGHTGLRDLRGRGEGDPGPGNCSRKKFFLVELGGLVHARRRIDQRRWPKRMKSPGNCLVPVIGDPINYSRRRRQFSQLAFGKELVAHFAEFEKSLEGRQGKESAPDQDLE